MWLRCPALVIAIASWVSCGSTSKDPQEAPALAPQGVPETPKERPPADEIAHLAPIDVGEPSSTLPGVSPLADVVRADREPLLACYGPLAGEVIVHLELRADGGVVGGSTEPAGGQAGLAAVADCVLDRARAWRFPRAFDAGTRILVVPLTVERSAPFSDDPNRP